MCNVMPRATTFFLTCVLVFSALFAHADGLATYPSLRESHDPRLQRVLERIVREAGLAWATDSHRLCLTLADITDPTEPRVAAINGDQMMYAASLPKIAILYAAIKDIEAGRLELDDDLYHQLSDMIRVSSNVEATRVLERVGTRRINRMLEAEPYRLYDPLVGGGLWVGKAYAKGVAYERDPLHAISHGATAMQTARFYYLLETGQLTTPELTRIAKSILADPGIRHKFVKGLAERPDARLYRKSGSWRRWHADSVLVESGGKRFVLVGLADHPRGGRWLETLALPVHDAVVRPERTRIATRNGR